MYIDSYYTNSQEYLWRAARFWLASTAAITSSSACHEERVASPRLSFRASETAAALLAAEAPKLGLPAPVPIRASAGRELVGGGGGGCDGRNRRLVRRAALDFDTSSVSGPGAAAKSYATG